jgi:hypothetical protein
MFVRIDPATEPLAFRGATVSRPEIDALRTIEHVVRARRVRHIGRSTISTDNGEVPGGAREVYVDCTEADVAESLASLVQHTRAAFGTFGAQGPRPRTPANAPHPALPALPRASALRRAQADACIDSDTALGQPHDGVEVELRDLR